jgi:hypothetical protein
MIHCIGDSHSAVFSGVELMTPEWPGRSDDRLPWFRTYRLGPVTAYQLERKLSIIQNVINRVGITTDDTILFCCGEVDCRAHLIKQMELQNKTVKEIVRECVDRYIEAVLQVKNWGMKVAVWGPIASWHPTKKYTGGPSFGTCLERNEVTKEFNDYAKEMCEKNSIPFYSIFYKMIDSEGYTNPDLLDNWDGAHIHANQKTIPLILEEFGLVEKNDTILISHRGNINGKNEKLENSPSYVKKALDLGYDVEVDVWVVNDKFYLGHDNPQYEIPIEFLKNEKLWCHAKNIIALNKMLENDIHCFWHQEDDVTLTSKGVMWTYPGKELTSNSIQVMPEWDNKEHKNIMGLCRDYVEKYKK